MSKLGTLFLSLSLAAMGFVQVPAAAAQPCPGSPIVISMIGVAKKFASVGMSPSRPIQAFIGTGCTFTKLGNATNCVSSVDASSSQLLAGWNSGTAAVADTTGGCRFNCQGGGTCVVRNDGLPVELLRFGVE